MKSNKIAIYKRQPGFLRLHVFLFFPDCSLRIRWQGVSACDVTFKGKFVWITSLFSVGAPVDLAIDLFLLENHNPGERGKKSYSSTISV